MINALVLAAGESRRMGQPKPLLRFGETTFLEQIVSVLRLSHVDRITVVLGAKAQTIRAALDLPGVDIVINEDYARGQLSSLIAGLGSVPPQTEALLLCLVDNPFITTDVANRVIRAFRETRRPIVIPVANHRRGHPALFARAVFEELRHAPADQGARYVVNADSDRVLEVDVRDGSILVGIDTPEDYRSHFGTDPAILRADQR
jgi:molybdenum cofactor cytidylyltransferase